MDLQTPNPLLQEPLVTTLTPAELAHYADIEHGPEHSLAKVGQAVQAELQFKQSELDEKDSELNSMEDDLNDIRDECEELEKELEAKKKNGQQLQELKEAVFEAIDADANEPERFTKLKELAGYTMPGERLKLQPIDQGDTDVA